MNLQTTIPMPLWMSVADSYESENYSHAILEATYFLSSTLRERAGVDGDGTSLVGQALGGDTPKLMINSLQTESERNIQKGMEQILRGIYLGIRNPRSHEQTTDDKETADAIIHFIGYAVNILNSSKETFTIALFMERVQDTEFVESLRYAEVLVDEIPKLRIGDALIEIFKWRTMLELRKFKHLISKLIENMSPQQLQSYVSVVSEELRTASDDQPIRKAFQMLTPELWGKVSELPRLRIENKVVSGIMAGKVLTSGKTTEPLATWANSLLKSFTTRNEVGNALIGQFDSFDAESRHYSAKFFMRCLPEVIVEPFQIYRCIKTIAEAIMIDDENVKAHLIAHVSSFPGEWQDQLAAALVEKTDADNPAVILHNGQPFLSSPSNNGFDEDIPF